MAKTGWSADELRSKAAAYCATAERCESEVRLKLQQWKCDSKTADEIVDFLYEHDFLNAERYCRAFVHDKVLFQGWGRVKIEYMLRAKHLPSSAIQLAIQTIDESAYNRALRKLIESKSKTLSEDSFDALVRFLLQRGFTYEEILKCFKN